MDELENTDERRITRRGSLVKLGGFLAAALATGGAKIDLSEGATDAQEGAGPAGVASGTITCVLTPELTEGPYYLANEKLRRNITEGKPGTALTLKLKVVNASTCKPIKGAAVDIWHCDALGVYSGIQQQKHGRQDVPPRNPENQCVRHRDLPDGLSASYVGALTMGVHRS
jgi:hypothetical protein